MSLEVMRNNINWELLNQLEEAIIKRYEFEDQLNQEGFTGDRGGAELIGNIEKAILNIKLIEKELILNITQNVLVYKIQHKKEE